jgi:hypothetical protein
MSPLESRKKLLIAESELNRAQLTQEWRTMADSVHSITGQARSISSLAVAGATFIGDLVAFRRKKAASPRPRNPWWVTVLTVAQVAGSLWLESRPRPKS